MKLEAISPETNFTNAVNLFVDHIEKSLKEISDVYLIAEKAKEENKGKKDEELRQICGIMKVILIGPHNGTFLNGSFDVSLR